MTKVLEPTFGVPQMVEVDVMGQKLVAFGERWNSLPWSAEHALDNAAKMLANLHSFFLGHRTFWELGEISGSLYFSSGVGSF